MKIHSFGIKKGQTIKKGKSHYPDLLYVSISYQQALDIIKVIANQLDELEHTENISVMLILTGKLKYHIKDE